MISRFFVFLFVLVPACAWCPGEFSVEQASSFLGGLEKVKPALYESFCVGSEDDDMPESPTRVTDLGMCTEETSSVAVDPLGQVFLEFLEQDMLAMEEHLAAFSAEGACILVEAVCAILHQEMVHQPARARLLGAVVKHLQALNESWMFDASALEHAIEGLQNALKEEYFASAVELVSLRSVFRLTGLALLAYAKSRDVSQLPAAKEHVRKLIACFYESMRTFIAKQVQEDKEDVLVEGSFDKVCEEHALLLDDILTRIAQQKYAYSYDSLVPGAKSAIEPKPLRRAEAIMGKVRRRDALQDICTRFGQPLGLGIEVLKKLILFHFPVSSAGDVDLLGEELRALFNRAVRSDAKLTIKDILSVFKAKSLYDESALLQLKMEKEAEDTRLKYLLGLSEFQSGVPLSYSFRVVFAQMVALEVFLASLDVVLKNNPSLCPAERDAVMRKIICAHHAYLKKCPDDHLLEQVCMHVRDVLASSYS